MVKWLRSYFLMIKWVFLSYRPWLPLFFAVQVCISVAFIYGMGYFYPVITPETAKFLITGAPTIILLTTGFVMVPQTVASQRTEGTFDYIWSLPVPRMAHIAADATVMVGTTLPSIVLAVVLGATHFGFSLDITWLVIPATILVAATGTFIGYSIAFSVPKPMMVNVITQIMVFIVMMFSPVMFPPERLPQWMQSIHLVLPIQYAADIMRGTITDLPVQLGLAFTVVGAWCLVCFALTYLLVRRRK
jgi:ABC-2 type transport system permease protein